MNLYPRKAPQGLQDLACECLQLLRIPTTNLEVDKMAAHSAEAARLLDKETHKLHQRLVEKGAVPRLGMYDVIRLPKSRDKSDPDPVPVCHNGNSYLLRRGHYLPVPHEVVMVLSDALEDDYVQEDGELRKTGQQVQRFPFELVFRKVPEQAYQRLRELSMSADMVGGAPLDYDTVSEIIEQARTSAQSKPKDVVKKD